MYKIDDTRYVLELNADELALVKNALLGREHDLQLSHDEPAKVERKLKETQRLHAALSSLDEDTDETRLWSSATQPDDDTATFSRDDLEAHF